MHRQGGFASLAHNFASSDSLVHEKRDSLSKHEELHGERYDIPLCLSSHTFSHDIALV